MAIEKAVKKAVSATDEYSQFIPIWGSTLYHIRDLPFNPKVTVCEQYGQLMNQLQGVSVRAELPPPSKGSLKFNCEYMKEAIVFVPTWRDPELAFAE